MDERPSDSGSLIGEGAPGGARGPGGKGAWGQLLKCSKGRRSEAAGRAFPVPGLRVRLGRRGAFRSGEGERGIVGGKRLGGGGPAGLDADGSEGGGKPGLVRDL